MSKLEVFCEYEKQPVGIDKTPRFSWRYADDTAGKVQTSYRVLVKNAKTEEVMWDSGCKSSAETLNIVYAGKELTSSTLYTCEVETTTDNQETMCASSSFRTGILKEEEWKASWIRPKLDLYSGKVFREWKPAGKVVDAIAYKAGLGYYEFYINGKKVGDELMNNAQTNYDKTVLYDCHDVTELVQEDIICLSFVLGHGWADRLMSDFSLAVDRQCAFLQMEVSYEDGTRETVVTEPHAWRSVYNGDFLANSVYKGVTVNKTTEAPGWNLPGYEAEHLEEVFYVELTEGPAGKMVYQDLEPERVTERLVPASITKKEDGRLLVDFGVNHSGYPSVRLHEEVGTVVELTYAEVLSSDGELDTRSYAWNAPKDTYICGGKEEVFEPRFTYHAYRYMVISGAKNEIKKEDITGCVFHNDVRKKGFFESGNDTINMMQKVVERTETNNLHAVPTDCPHRELGGWLNDMTGRAEQAVYNYDLTKLYYKWVRDIRDTQGKRTGTISDTAPFLHGPRNGAPVNTSYLLAPWLIYLHSNDKRILEDYYDGLKRWEGYLTSTSDNDLILWAHYGDWCQPAAYTIKDRWGIGAISGNTPGPLMASAYYYYNAVLLAKMAKVLDQKEDIVYYTELAERVKTAFNHKWLDEEKGNYATGSQACNAIALWAGLVPEQQEQAVAKNLAEDVIAKGYHLSTGNLCTKYLVEMLFRYHYEDVAYQMLAQTTYPSWGFMFSKGATTYWERWEYDDEEQRGMMSYDHPMQGSACSAFHSYLAGIRPCEDAPGFAGIEIHPYPVQALGYVKARQETKSGTIVSEWKYDEQGNYIQDNRIPFNCHADIWVPMKDAKEVSLGQSVLYKDGKILAEDNTDIKVTGIEDGCLKVAAGAGRYTFTVKK